MTQTSRSAQTRVRLQERALDLFEQHGYDQTTTAEIAAAAGVSEMTLFRHFPTKAALLGDDPYDPLIADGVAAQPADLPPIARVVAGVRAAWQSIPPAAEDEIRRRLRIAIAAPSLVGTMRANTTATEEAIASALVSGGCPAPDARIAAAAVLAALMQALTDWAAGSDATLDSAVRRALDVVEGVRA